jgi:hypothetical protein
MSTSKITLTLGPSGLGFEKTSVYERRVAREQERPELTPTGRRLASLTPLFRGPAARGERYLLPCDIADGGKVATRFGCRDRQVVARVELAEPLELRGPDFNLHRGSAVLDGRFGSWLYQRPFQDVAWTLFEGLDADPIANDLIPKGRGVEAEAMTLGRARELLAEAAGPRRFLRLVSDEAFVETAEKTVSGPLAWHEHDHAEALRALDPDAFGRVAGLRSAGPAHAYSLLGHRRAFADAIDEADYADVPDARVSPIGSVADELRRLRQGEPAAAADRYYWQWMLEQLGPASRVEDRLAVFRLMLEHWRPPRGWIASAGQANTVPHLLDGWGMTPEDLPVF